MCCSGVLLCDLLSATTRGLKMCWKQLAPELTANWTAPGSVEYQNKQSIGLLLSFTPYGRKQLCYHLDP